MFNFEKLDVWQEAIQFADLVYELTRRLSGRRALRIDESDAARSRFDFIEPRGGYFTCVTHGFRSVCRNRDGFSVRGCFANYHRASAKDDCPGRSRSDLRGSGKAEQNAQRIAQVFV